MIEQANQRISSLYAWIALAIMTALCSPVWAQAEEAVEQLRPPKTTDAPSSPKYLMMGILLVLFAGVIVAVTLKAKRGHQD